MDMGMDMASTAGFRSHRVTSNGGPSHGLQQLHRKQDADQPRRAVAVALFFP